MDGERLLDEVMTDDAFSGVVRVDLDGETFARASGFADRAHRIPNTVDTVFALASGTKGFTALAVMCLVEDGALSLSTTARSVLGSDLPLIDDAVTVEHLLAHRSGIGDYFDEDLELPITDFVLDTPVHTLGSIEAYVPVLDGFPTKFAPGERFSYSNGGYVVLALIAERVSGVPYDELVRERVCRPAGMTDTGFLRADEPRANVAIGYLDETGPRTNVLHMPPLGGGDGGISSTAADISAFWTALFEGRIVPRERVGQMTTPHSEAPEKPGPYGWGFWLGRTQPFVELHGYDAGISFISTHDAARRLTVTVISNTAEGAWPVAERLDDRFFRDGAS